MKYEMAGKIIKERREIVPHSENNLCNNITDIAGPWQGVGPAKERMFRKNEGFGPGMVTRVGCGICDMILSIVNSHLRIFSRILP